MTKNSKTFTPRDLAQRSPDEIYKLAMPDIANETKAALEYALEKVGMSSIDVPLYIESKDGTKLRLQASADAYVSLDKKDSKGIHMSRLFLLLEEGLQEQTLSTSQLHSILNSFLKSHEGLSKSAHLNLQFKYLAQKPSLLSDNYGWRSYPIKIISSQTPDEFSFELSTEIVYSSTCPCSAALARQIIQQKFEKDYPNPEEKIEASTIASWLLKEESICATPHSQRSYAKLRLRFKKNEFQLNSDFLDTLIDSIEDALQTPVQAAVKREDEQEFARLNGRNLMFCEDAAKKVKDSLEKNSIIADYKIFIEHQESLHPHNAVAVSTKGIPGGFIA